MTAMKGLSYLTVGGIALALLAATPAAAQNYQQHNQDRYANSQGVVLGAYAGTQYGYGQDRNYRDDDYYGDDDRYRDEREAHRRHDARHARQHQREHARERQRQHARQHQRQHHRQHDRQHWRGW